MAENNRNTFELGLIMAGAVSAGAYTAGVVDFLMEALDAWDTAKSMPGVQVPRHAVKIRVMSGASAGAMTAAMAAIAFHSETKPVWEIGNPPPPENNRLFDSWVRRIDIKHLLGTRDLASGKVVSLLDSSPLQPIANDALVTEPRTVPRSWVDDPLAVLLSVANLRGVPYGFHLFGTRHDNYGMTNHMDMMRFGIGRNGATVKRALPLDPADAPGGEWKKLALAALASGAFPIGLQPRLLSRPPEDLDGRFERNPAWDSPPHPYEFLCVDGGLMNNEPLEAARQYLSGGANKKNPREGNKAHRAVVLIDPFPNEASYSTDYVPDESVTSVAAKMFGALKNQARFKPEELNLAEEPDVFSRFMISPARYDAAGAAVEPAMASAILGGFGGFLHESFRRHDFQLGRLNCQAFLARHFVLAETNPLFKDLDPDLRQRMLVRDRDGNERRVAVKGAGECGILPIIPLLGTAERELVAPTPPSPDNLDILDLTNRVRERVRAVGDSLIDSELSDVVGGFLRFVLGTAWNSKISDKVTENIMAKIGKELDRLRSA